MTIKKILLTCVLCLYFLAGAIAGASNLWEGKGRIACSSDGNKHDNDDMQATMMTLMILAKAGLQENTVLYTYADHVWASENNDLAIMKESAEGGGERFGFQSTKFLAAVSDPEAAYNAMRDEIVKSTAEDPLYIIAAGPMQVVGEGLDRANALTPASLNHVTVISHSVWNDKHADNYSKSGFHAESAHSGWTWDEMKTAFGTKVNFNHISDQNGTGEGSQAYKSKDKFSAPAWSNWAWMGAHKDPNINWVYTKGQANPGGPDYSDAGMAYYFCADLDGVRGDEFGNPVKLEKWIGTEEIPVVIDPTRVSKVSLNTTSHHIKDLNGTFQLTATVEPSTAVDKSVAWKSSNEAVATVSATGLITGHKIGYAEITVTTTDNGKVARATIQVGEVEAADYCVGEDFIAFEAEATNSDLGKWKVRTPGWSQYVEGTSGVLPLNDTYLEYTGGTENGNPSGNDILVYKFTPISDGAYRLTGRMAQNLQGAVWDKCNDIYVKMQGDFTSGNATPMNLLTSWTKLYGRGHDGGKPLKGDWGAFVKMDVNHKKYTPVYNLKSGVEYTFSISGRATRTSIDYFLFVKEQDGVTIAERKDLITHTPARMSPTCIPVNGCMTVRAHDFDVTNVAGFDPATKGKIPGTPADGINKGEQVIGCGGNNGKTKPIAAEEIYNGADTDATFTVKAVSEPDGECTYAVYVNGVKVGEKQTSRIFDTDIPPYTYEDLVMNDTPVAIKKGDVIRVTSNQVSNNLVPEGDGFATARGRWVSLDICGLGITSRSEALGVVDFSGFILNTVDEIPVKVSYTANEARDIYVAIHQPTGELIKSKTVSVEAGKSVATVTIALDGSLALANDYSVKVELRPDGGIDGSAVLNEVETFNVVETLPTLEDLVSFSSFPSQLTNGMTEISAVISYSASENRYINFALHEAVGNKFITNIKYDVTQGSGQVTLTLPLTAALAVGTDYKLSTAIRPPGGNWSSNIDDDDKVLSTVDASSAPNIPVTGVSLTITSFSLDAKDATQQLTATIEPVDATNKGVTWESSDDGVATVDGSGLVTAVANGTADITVKTKDGNYTAVAKLTVTIDGSATPDIAVTGVSIAAESVTLESEGATEQLIATITPSDATNKSVTWESSDDGVVTVNASGMVTAMASGTATITVKSQDGNHTAVSTITVEIDEDPGEVSAIATLEGGLKVFPNPSTGEVQINCKQGTEIRILGMSGRLLRVIYASKRNPIIDLSGLGSGLYVIHLTLDGETEVKRLNLI
ncbi:Ig-like domain-containing protein [Reichenbachiella versicolor]|uniref:Ig-like domain-containing protein n=1 Tax=Reichenbachiella versicolor TaxID=1821036 RepID=UPI0013A5A434|nr:Ig-like domain-containing protein [Reichenbachiella versicolor]